jgi:DNA-binding response OmpR family regulator
MTALNDPEYCATEVGAAGFVAKPFEVGELLQQVEHMQRAA